MKPQILSCATCALALSFSPAIASKIIGNGFLPDGTECMVGTVLNCTPKLQTAGFVVNADGVMRDGRECILASKAQGCSPKPATIADGLATVSDSVTKP